MKKTVLVLAFFSLGLSFIPVNAAEQTTPKVKVEPSSSKYSLEVTINDIPKDQQTLFIPIKIDTMILDFDKVALEDISAQNILAVASSSKDKVGTGIGLLKLDEKGLPPNLTLKVLLKQVGEGQTSVSLLQVADEPALLSRGAVIDNGITVSIKDNEELNITEKTENNKKRLALSKSRITLDIKRPAQKEETIFIPLVFDRNLIDLEETFGHSVIGPGITAKTFSTSTLEGDGPGVEIVLGADAEKDFSVDVDLFPKGIGNLKLTAAYPQRGHTSVVVGTMIGINPPAITVANYSTAKTD